MKDKIDIGVFVKKAFKSDEQHQQPDKKVIERIYKTLDKQKTNKKNILLWLLFSVLLIGLASYLFLDIVSTGLQNKNENNQTKEESNKFGSSPFIGPEAFSELQHQNSDTLIPNNTSYYSLIQDTLHRTYQNLTNKKTLETKTHNLNTNYDVDKLFNQKTIHYYYRGADSLKIETTDKRVIDSILSVKDNQ